ncbi:MAG TPA: universal stress protein [Acidobacteriota bacterium]|nr:universal stress protein [Acidobacteriota bacterium]HOT01897.1 universal stress protein [Acidobacteriota bacterium]HQF86819.1 universal stress protein [Acidobacteriota bacterium]HQG91383.1 universal stress protein [Acidobacteriota bacterium]HQK87864.1 universal stress protein [Acidobacteriota bacterium]
MSADSARPILCPTDFSAEAGHALRWGGELALRLSRPLVALYADRFLPPPHFTARQIDILVEELDQSRTVARQALVDQAGRMIAPAVATEPVVVQDLAVPAIIRLAAERNAEMIVMGSHGHSALDRIMLGSVTERVLRLADRPVLAVKLSAEKDPAAFPEIRTILCPVDLGEDARPALLLAARLATAFAAELQVLHVAEAAPDPDVERAAREALCAWVPDTARTSCRLHEVVRPGKPAEEILLAAQESHAELIVLPTRHKLFQDVTVLGATVARITRHASCAVLAVPVV